MNETYGRKVKVSYEGQGRHKTAVESQRARKQARGSLSNTDQTHARLESAKRPRSTAECFSGEETKLWAGPPRASLSSGTWSLDDSMKQRVTLQIALLEWNFIALVLYDP
ncbi:hypothetical protein E2C01_001052 [Portunus trituberculatus]|uniref:Uncharacterized protein n=1 Tax=Portunus trituberculatus TaxID=210409 RepID=A0A5B7CGS8_PORTR|nr:hypothetical protein [Portunus trituberculatus]